MNNILETPMEFIENSILLASEAFKQENLLIDKTHGSDLQRAYFIGRTLCLDVEDEFGIGGVITINHSNESFGYFSGGLRRLLSIEACRRLESLMTQVGINHAPKWNK
jgi:hypothetical protein